MTRIKPESVAVVFTGKAYARVLTDFETTQLPGSRTFHTAEC